MLKTSISTQMKLNSRRLYVLFSRQISLKRQTNNIGFGGYALLAVPITTFCLGTWQVKRREWKLNLINGVKKKTAAEPVELPDDLEELSKMEYQRIHVRGTFDHSKEMYLGPRQLMTESAEGGSLMSVRSQSGNLVITPFHVTDKGVTILVNRGWVPRDKTNPSTRSEGQVTDEIDLVGVVRLHENRPQFCPKTKLTSNYFHFRDVLTMASMSGALPIFIDADTTIPGGPIGSQTRVTFRNEHLSYIITWYSLSFATLYMWYKKYIRKPKLAL